MTNTFGFLVAIQSLPILSSSQFRLRRIVPGTFTGAEGRSDRNAELRQTCPASDSGVQAPADVTGRADSAPPDEWLMPAGSVVRILLPANGFSRFKR
jgi:hypothetical protein